MTRKDQVVFSGTMDEFDNYIVPNTLFVSLIATPPVEEIREIPGVVAVEELGGSKFRIQFSDALEATERLVETSVTPKVAIGRNPSGEKVPWMRFLQNYQRNND